MAKTSQGLTVILSRAKAGDERARGELIALIYDELRRVASRLMLRERAGHTLTPTAVVHEATAPCRRGGSSTCCGRFARHSALRCLAKEPTERFPDAESLERALGACSCAEYWDRERAAQWCHQAPE